LVFLDLIYRFFFNIYSSELNSEEEDEEKLLKTTDEVIEVNFVGVLSVTVPIVPVNIS